jgi:hypothetical protein
MNKWLLVALLLVSQVANAVEATAILTWSQPTTRVNGTTLASSEIKLYTVMWGLTSGNWPNTMEIPAPTLTYNWASTIDIPVGLSKTVYYTVTVTTWTGETSDPATEQSKTFTRTSSSKPSPLTFTIEGVTCKAAPGFKCTYN